MNNQTEKKSFILLSLGTNMGEKREVLEKAIDALIRDEVVSEVVVSSFYKTEPYGVYDQGWFVNVCVCGFTYLPPYTTLDRCKKIEQRFGRQKRDKWHKRELDIDIIFFGNENFDEKDLTIPHKEYKKRNFVLVPASEIAGDFVSPNSEMRLSEEAKNCSDNSKIEKLD